MWSRFGVQFSFVDTVDTDTVAPSTRLLWLETPSNPLLRVTLIAKTCALARGIAIDPRTSARLLIARLRILAHHRHSVHRHRRLQQARGTRRARGRDNHFIGRLS